MIATHLRILLAPVVAGIVTAMLGACASDPVRDRLPAAGERKSVLAPIEGAELVEREAFPRRYAVRITSGLPDGCTRFDRIEVRREGENLDLNVWNTVPADDRVVCTMIYATARHTVELGAGFVAGVTYTVRINGEPRLAFTAR